MNLDTTKIKDMDKKQLIYFKGYIEGIKSVRKLQTNEQNYYNILMKRFNKEFIENIDEVYKSMFE